MTEKDLKEKYEEYLREEKENLIIAFLRMS